MCEISFNFSGRLPLDVRVQSGREEPSSPACPRAARAAKPLISLRAPAHKKRTLPLRILYPPVCSGPAAGKPFRLPILPAAKGFPHRLWDRFSHPERLHQLLHRILARHHDHLARIPDLPAVLAGQDKIRFHADCHITNAAQPFQRIL